MQVICLSVCLSVADKRVGSLSWSDEATESSLICEEGGCLELSGSKLIANMKAVLVKLRDSRMEGVRR